MTREKLFSKRVRARRLKAYPELTALGIGWGASLIIGLLLLAGCYDRETGLRLGGGALFAALYLFAGALCLVLYIAARIRVAAGGGIPLRRLGYLAILTAFTGNVFAAIAGFSIIREKRSLEYELCYYALLNDLLVMLISLLNYFKDVLAAYFYVGIGLLAATVVLYLAALVAIERAQASGHYRRLAPLAVVLILSAGLGNLFALLLGLVILVRIKNEGNARTIQWVDTIRRIYRNYMAVLGFLIISLLFTLAVVSAFTFHYGYAVSNDYGNLLREPCLEYPFGTDNLGLCVFTRIVFGARISLIIGIISTAVPIVVGGLLGHPHPGRALRHPLHPFDDRHRGGLRRQYSEPDRGAEHQQRAGLRPHHARPGHEMAANSEFVEAARSCGRHEWQILVLHIIPNSLAQIIVRASVSIGIAVLSTSSLSYLGLGVEPHIPEWGNILKVGSPYLETDPYLAIYPGLFIIVLVLAFNFLGDGLRDALDPKLK